MGSRTTAAVQAACGENQPDQQAWGAETGPTDPSLPPAYLVLSQQKTTDGRHQAAALPLFAVATEKNRQQEKSDCSCI